MAEELLEINENDEVTNVGVNGVAPEQEEPVNPFFAYLQNAFNKERSESFVETLNEEQKKFVFAFVSGFQSAIGHSVVGVYDYNYIDGFHFTPEILQTVNVVLRPIEVTDLEMKFVVVAQY
jgi:hypothetical protein